MSQPALLMDLPIAEPLTKVTPYHRGVIRVKRPVRNQAEMMVRDLDSLIADDHTVRSIWSFSEGSTSWTYRLFIAPSRHLWISPEDRPAILRYF